MKRIIKAGLMLLLGAAIWTNGGVEKADAQTGGYWEQAQQQQQQQQRQQEQINQQNQMMYSPQYACVGGRDVYGYIGDAACGGGVNTNNTAPPPIIQKPSSYGAVAWGNGYYGSVVNQATKQNAIDAALQKCGSGDCQVRTTYWNQCVAVSYGALKAGTSYWQSAVATTQSKAEKDSIKSCNKRAKNCKILLSECSLP